MLKHAKECMAYSMMFCLGCLVSCGEGKIGVGPVNVPVAAILRMLSSSLHRPAIFPTNTGNQPVLATMFGGQVSPQVTVSNPSELAQSYESICDAYGPSAGGTIHAALGSTGIVSLNFLGGNICDPIAAVGADESSHPLGFPIILTGKVNTLVVYGSFASGTPFRCLDTTNVASLQDSAFVRAYYDLAHDAVFLGSGTTQLPVTCSIVIPPGDDVQHITVQWLKS
jgi:hypothetical protein